jgi:hypothetical protein
MKETAIYTAIFNSYDTLKEPEAITSNCDFICFTNDTSLKSKNWQIIVLEDKTYSASLNNRRLKLLGPYFELKDYKNSLYVDGTILIKSDLASFLADYSQFGMVNFKHPRRSCIYQEFASCIAEKKGDPNKVILQCHDYSMENMPFEFGLSDNKIIFRNHNNMQVKKIMFEWWDNVIKYSGRDQTCLPYVLFKNGMTYTFFRENLLNNDFFEVWPHKNEYKRRIWRNFKLFCRRHGIFVKQLNYLDNRIKSHLSPKGSISTI